MHRKLRDPYAAVLIRLVTDIGSPSVELVRVLIFLEEG